MLDWDDKDLSEDVKNLGGLDAIMYVCFENVDCNYPSYLGRMADVTYNTTSFPALSRTLLRLSRMGSQPPAILLGYKERDEGERSFWEMAAQVGIKFQKIGERGGTGGAPVEIWLGYCEA